MDNETESTTAATTEVKDVIDEEELLEQDENRPLPPVAPSELLTGLSQLWGYPWKGIEASRETLAQMTNSDALEAYRGQLVHLQESLEAYEHTDETIVGADAYQLEYSRLFVGSFRMYAPPYASYYVDGEEQVYGPTTVEIEDLYAQFGIELGENEHDMPDHIRFLLAFLAMLAKTYELKGVADFAYAYEDFKADYLMTWANDFAAKVNEFAEHPFFRDLVTFTLSIV